ncbi:hypothetical protein ACIRU3_33405 [Streptomyces sp. NPDC101151]|uniref:hypothetical protein n=1 Tax=Streptomyces sp. NPDC101151 TaxID=3366115 RepID=UPI003827057D
MQGHGYAQPVKQPPHPAWLVVLRVVFVAVGIFSIGFLTWVLMLRLAAVTRRSLDWGLFVAVLAADILSVVLLAGEPGDEVHTPGGYLGMTLLLGALGVTLVYYLVADIRHFQKLQRAYAGGPAVSAYGYPQPPSPFTATTVPQGRAPVGRPPVTPTGPHTPLPQPPLTTPQPPLTTPPPQRPAPARIDQVRAELDELSDYLRKHDGHDDGMQGAGHEDGR